MKKQKIFLFLVLCFQLQLEQAKAQNRRTVEFFPEPVKFCLESVRGDRDFMGHGPHVVAEASLRISGGKQIIVDCEVIMTETGGDLTTGKVKFSRAIYAAPIGSQIVSLQGDANLSAKTEYKDTNHDVDRPAMKNKRNWLKFFELNGDTPGLDIFCEGEANFESNNFFDNSNSFVRLIFDKLNITIEKESPTGTTFKFKPSDIKRICPEYIGKDLKVDGDLDFGGHGPDVNVIVEIKISNDKNQVVADIFFEAVETRPDFTKARIKTTKVLYKALSGKKIAQVKYSTFPHRFLTPGANANNDRTEINYRDTNHELDVHEVSNSIVKRISVMGDTPGTDVGHCTSNDTYLDIEFAEVEITVVPQ